MKYIAISIKLCPFSYSFKIHWKRENIYNKVLKQTKNLLVKQGIQVADINNVPFFLV
jgi:hypothetical protein